MCWYDPELITKGKIINKCRCGGRAIPFKEVDYVTKETKGFSLKCINKNCKRETLVKATLDEAIISWNNEEVIN
jgi:hypothetical protein